jgi:hypothetical protein
VANDLFRDLVGTKYLHLALDRRRVDRGILDDRLRTEQIKLLRIDKQLGSSRVRFRSYLDIDDAEQTACQRRRADQPESPL